MNRSASAQQMSDESLQVLVLARLYPYLSSDQRDHVLLTGLAISEEKSRARVLAELGPHLPPNHVVRAWKGAQKIKKLTLRATALAGLGRNPHLPLDLVRQALEDERQLRESEDGQIVLAFQRAAWLQFMSALVRCLPEEQRGPILDDVLRVAGGWTGHLDPFPALLQFGPYLPPDHLRQALDDARGIVIEENRATVLATLAQAPSLTPVLAIKALKDAHGMKDEWARALAMSAVVPRLPEKERGPALADALRAIEGMKSGTSEWIAFPMKQSDKQGQSCQPEEFGRVMALSWLAPLLSADQLTDAFLWVLHFEIEVERAYALVALGTALAKLSNAPSLPPDLVRRAVKNAQDMKGEWRSVTGMALSSP
jgi:hypothetical protein